ncbi:SPFH domain-containing protein [Demequina lutea]|uniref:Regulator of protease activity HflC (Stomatin/prohibitin superfamily) n=1 Tax=Demequina lutea TaxID=431489 RepID=A0A7Z0CK83_9MICO|nr:SPFH domain-containing protein [Demequina lutea]NYI41597.1 regulator of protease activity HflC (stomatin/prohibitin superfamily) [Demequina lutea]
MTPVQIAGLVVLGIVAIFVISAIARSIVVVRQTKAYLVERLGRYSRTLDAGLHLLVPFLDRVRAQVDLKEQVYPTPPQSVITSDNLVVDIDSVIYLQVTDARAAVYEIANYWIGVEQLTATTLRNIVGTMDLEQALTGRDHINGHLRGVLDEATGKWGIRVNRVEIKAIEPPVSIKDSMEKQMRAERDRRAAILTAEGVKQSAILMAEGEKQSAILMAEGDAQSKILRAEGEARAILQVFDAIHEGDADSKLLAYQYLQMLPEIAKTDSNKIWFVPTEFTGALKAVAAGFGGAEEPEPLNRDPERAKRRTPLTNVLTDPRVALEEARRMAESVSADAESAGSASGATFDPNVSKGQQPG